MNYIIPVILFLIIIAFTFNKKCEEKSDIDCVVSEWPNYGICSKPCNSGKHSRIRQIITQKKGKGKDCLFLEEEKICNEQKCDIKCKKNYVYKDNKCMEQCPSGYIDNGLTCVGHANGLVGDRKIKLSGQFIGRLPKDNEKTTCNDNEYKVGLFCYPQCIKDNHTNCIKVEMIHTKDIYYRTE